MGGRTRWDLGLRWARERASRRRGRSRCAAGAQQLPVLRGSTASEQQRHRRRSSTASADCAASERLAGAAGATLDSQRSRSARRRLRGTLFDAAEQRRQRLALCVCLHACGLRAPAAGKQRVRPAALERWDRRRRHRRRAAPACIIRHPRLGARRRCCSWQGQSSAWGTAPVSCASRVRARRLRSANTLQPLRARPHKECGAPQAHRPRARPPRPAHGAGRPVSSTLVETSASVVRGRCGREMHLDLLAVGGGRSEQDACREVRAKSGAEPSCC